MYKRPEPWLALDDDHWGWADEHRWNLVECDPHDGIRNPARLRELVEKLEAIRNGRAP